jgi:hypothetical protein
MSVFHSLTAWLIAYMSGWRVVHTFATLLGEFIPTKYLCHAYLSVWGNVQQKIGRIRSVSVIVVEVSWIVARPAVSSSKG